MSTFESAIWHFLGYSAIPLILLTGIAISALVFYFIRGIFSRGGEDQ